MAYDRAITVFSPDGRLFQVEYAREAVKRGTTTVGVKFKDGVILIVDKRLSSKLIEPKSIEKIFTLLHDYIDCRRNTGTDHICFGVINLMKSQFQQATLATYIASIIPMYVGFSIIHSEFLIIFGLTIIILNSIITAITT